MERVPGRAWYLAFAVGTIAVGLAFHRWGRRMLPHVGADVIGDALWAAMIVWWVGVVAPRWSIGGRAVLSIVVCYAVEVGQLWHPAWLESVRRTTLGHLVLGSGFEWRDLASYFGGVLAAAGVDAWISTRPSTASRRSRSFKA